MDLVEKVTALEAKLKLFSDGWNEASQDTLWLDAAGLGISLHGIGEASVLRDLIEDWRKTRGALKALADRHRWILGFDGGCICDQHIAADALVQGLREKGGGVE